MFLTCIKPRGALGELQYAGTVLAVVHHQATQSKEDSYMFEMKAISPKIKPKFVLLVPCLVLFAACSSKQIKNASLGPLDLPAEETYSAPVEYNGGASTKKVRKTMMAARGSVKKKAARGKSVARLMAKPAERMPVIGESTLAMAPVQMPPLAPPIPMNLAVEAPPQPNWVLAGLTMAGIVVLLAIGFRLHRYSARKRGLIYN